MLYLCAWFDLFGKLVVRFKRVYRKTINFIVNNYYNDSPHKSKMN